MTADPVPEGCSCKRYPHTCHAESTYYAQQATRPVNRSVALAELRHLRYSFWDMIEAIAQHRKARIWRK